MAKKKRNVLVLNSDSFRWDNLTVHGGTHAHTPNLDALAQQSVIFEQAYAGSYPTLPNRADAFLGTWLFPNADWGPLDQDAITLADVVTDAGAAATLVMDCPHMAKEGMWFQRGFTSWQWVRGQENDLLAPLHLVNSINPPGKKSNYRQPLAPMQRHMANQIVRKRVRDEDYLMAEVARTAVEDMKNLRLGDQWFMWVDMFDPHEPFDPPRHYFDMYMPGYKGVVYEIPVYGKCDCYSKDELAAIRAAYLGEVTMVDTWMGYILKNLSDLGMADDTVVVFTSDHGIAYGDHGYTGKNISPQYANIARIPLLISTPETRATAKGRKVSKMVQPVDLMPTVLEAMGIRQPKGAGGAGVSLMPFLEGKTVKTHEAAFTGAYPKGPNKNTPGGHLRVSTTDWALVVPPLIAGKRDKPMLFNLKNDPAEKRDVIKSKMKVAKDLYAKYLDFHHANSPTGEGLICPSPEEML